MLNPGAANLVFLLITTQSIGSLELGHCSAIGLSRVSAARIVGALLFIAGAVLIVKYRGGELGARYA